MKTAQPDTVAVSRVNPGETLRKAREARGWAVAEVATQLNLTTQRLTQIEQGEFDKVPGHTFARGYVRAYAKLLGLDQVQLVQQFDAFTGTSAVESDVHSLNRIVEPRNISQRVLKIVSVVALVGLAGLSFYWWQDQAERREQNLATTSLEHVEVDGADGTTQIHALDEPEDQAVEAAQQEVTQELLLTPESTEQPPAAESVDPLTTPAAAPNQPVAPLPVAPVTAAPVAAPVLAAVPTVAAPAPAVAPLQAGAGEALIDLTFSADCWVQVKDAAGKVLHASLKRKGESFQVVGLAPLELRLGYARAASVRLNGAEVDVEPFISGETARLKLGGQ